MNPLIDVALQVFPEIVRHLARDGTGGTAQAVADAVRHAAGTSDPQQAADAVAKDPAKARALRLSLASIAAGAEANLHNADLKTLAATIGKAVAPAKDAEDEKASQDRMEAFAQKLTKSAGPMIWGSVSVSMIVVLSFVLLLVLIVANPDRFAALQQNQVAFQIVNITIGALTAAFATVVSFWLGSSQDSRNKDAAALTMQVAQSEHAHELVKAQSDQAERFFQQSRQAAPPPATMAPKAVQPAASPTPAPAGAPKEARAAAAAPAPTTRVAPDAPPAAAPGARFDACIGVVLKEEGGFVDNPADPGGATNMGITLKTLEDWRGHPVTAADVKDLTVGEAKQIYQARYWNALRCHDLRPGVDLVVFDFGVNAGVSRAAKTLQACTGAAEDGVVGPVTVGACGKFTSPDLIESYSGKRLAFYKALPDFKTFGTDWTNRVKSVETTALDMARAG